MKRYILTLFVIATLNLPVSSMSMDEGVTAAIVGSAGLVSLVATLFVQPNYTEMAKNATSQQELATINACAQNHARDITMLKEEFFKCLKPNAILIYEDCRKNPEKNKWLIGDLD